jgi:hypothetical protein
MRGRGAIRMSLLGRRMFEESIGMRKRIKKMCSHDIEWK